MPEAEAFMAWLAKDKDRWTHSMYSDLHTPDPRVYSQWELESAVAKFRAAENTIDRADHLRAEAKNAIA